MSRPTAELQAEGCWWICKRYPLRYPSQHLTSCSLYSPYVEPIFSVYQTCQNCLYIPYSPSRGAVLTLEFNLAVMPPNDVAGCAQPRYLFLSFSCFYFRSLFYERCVPSPSPPSHALGASFPLIFWSLRTHASRPVALERPLMVFLPVRPDV